MTILENKETCSLTNFDSVSLENSELDLTIEISKQTTDNQMIKKHI